MKPSDQFLANFVVISFLFAASFSFGATQQFDEQGNLTGATGVIVLGNIPRIYDIELRDTTCASEYNGCDVNELADFPFGSNPNPGALAIVDQVLPGLTSDQITGCFRTEHPRLSFCDLLTPGTQSNAIVVSPARVDFEGNVGFPGNSFVAADFDFTQASTRVLVVWTLRGTAPHCADNIDNDGDGLVDSDDPGCEDPNDDTETSPPFVEPQEYLSLDDSPFSGQNFSFFHLEDFEDGALNTPGVTAFPEIQPQVGFPGILPPGTFTDSVDADDGVIDGLGRDGRSLIMNPGPTGVTFTFDPNVLGGLPTHVGIVLTDANQLQEPTVALEVLNALGESTVFGPVPLPTMGSKGTTDEDRFLGVIETSGVSAIRVFTNTPSMEVDHLQYGSIAPDNLAPQAVAGPDQAVRPGDIVFLDGTASFDDNTPTQDLLFDWSFISRPDGSLAEIQNANAPMSSFVTDVPGTYIVQLSVTDMQGLDSSPAEVVISSDNLAPTADAGSDQLVLIGSTVALNGSSSSDPEGDALTFSWQLTDKPTGSSATLADETTASPTFVADVAGQFEILLVVSDSIGPGMTDTVVVTSTTAQSFAETHILSANDLITALDPGDVTSVGNQNALQNFLRQAVLAIQIGDVAEAINKLDKALVRVDGCTLRGSADGNGPGRDWITDCGEQALIYAALKTASDAL